MDAGSHWVQVTDKRTYDTKNFLLPATLSSARARGPDCCWIIGCGPHTQCQSLSSRLDMKFNEVQVYALLQVNFPLSAAIFLHVWKWQLERQMTYCKYVQAHRKVGGILFEINCFWHLESLEIFKKCVWSCCLSCFDRKTTNTFLLLFT